MAGITERERELRTKRAELWDKNEALMKRYNDEESKENRPTVEEMKAYHERNKEIDALKVELDMVVEHRDRKSAEKEAADYRGVSTDEAESEKELAERAFSAFLKYGGTPDIVRQAEARNLLVPQFEGRSAAPEERLSPLSTAPGAPAAGSTLSGEGGYLVPQGFWHNLQVAMKAFGGTAPLFRQIRTATGNPMPWPSTDPTSIVGSLLSENTQVSEVDFSFGQGMLSAWTFTSGLHLASIQIVNDSAFDVDQFVRDRVSEALGRAQAQYAYSGTGASQPLGVNTAINAKGAGSVGAGGYYALTAAHTINTFGGGTPTELVSGALGFDTILKMITYVDPAYRNAGNCSWVMNDTTMQAQRAVTSTTGFPLWQPNVQVGGTAADRLYGYPVVIDQNVASLTASTTAGPIFGALDHAMVQRTVDQAGLLRLVERYADFLQVGFIGFARWDSRSNDLRAVTQAHAAAT